MLCASESGLRARPLARASIPIARRDSASGRRELEPAPGEELPVLHPATSGRIGCDTARNHGTFARAHLAPVRVHLESARADLASVPRLGYCSVTSSPLRLDPLHVELRVGRALAHEVEADGVFQFARAEEVEDPLAVAELALEVFVGLVFQFGRD